MFGNLALRLGVLALVVALSGVRGAVAHAQEPFRSRCGVDGYGFRKGRSSARWRPTPRVSAPS